MDGQGRAFIPPERLLRVLLLQAFYSLRSERQLVERIELRDGDLVQYRHLSLPFPI